jgi:hypothetical protein
LIPGQRWRVQHPHYQHQHQHRRQQLSPLLRPLFTRLPQRQWLRRTQCLRPRPRKRSIYLGTNPEQSRLPLSLGRSLNLRLPQSQLTIP